MNGRILGEVESARYQGVNVNHPSIVTGIRNLIQQKRYTTEEIARIIGMPLEVIRKHEKEMQQEEAKKMK